MGRGGGGRKEEGNEKLTLHYAAWVKCVGEWGRLGANERYMFTNTLTALSSAVRLRHVRGAGARERIA